MKQHYTLLLIIFVLLSSTLKSDEHKDTPQEVWATIFIHGIISVKPHLSIANFVRFIQDKIANTTYAHTVEIIRRNPFFYQYHPMQDIGLHPIDLSLEKPGAAATIFAHAYNTFHNSLEKKVHCTNYYYTFGWSGLLSARMRSLEAELLYQALHNLIQEFYDRNISLKIRLVGYSHGGNVALQLATIANFPDYAQKKVMIEELVLLGVPVLPDGVTYIEHPLFKSIYHIFSLQDRVQKLDCFAVNRFFSDRVFRPLDKQTLPAKLTQIQLNIRRPKNNGSKIYSEDKYTVCMKHRAQLRNANPGHTELWSFGWTPSHYRENFPLYPLPAGVLIPTIIEPLKNHNLLGKNVVIEFHPWQECMVISSESLQKELLLPFMSHEDLAALKAQALTYKPNGFNHTTFDIHVQEALQKAHAVKQTIVLPNRQGRYYRRSRIRT